MKAIINNVSKLKFEYLLYDYVKWLSIDEFWVECQVDVPLLLIFLEMYCHF